MKHIGDKGVRTREDAESYLREGPISSYEHFGYGLFAVTPTDYPGIAMGVCGFVRREGLDDPDLGFAFLKRFWGQGFAIEAAAAAIRHARESCGIETILAYADADNRASVKLLEKLGFEHTGAICMPGEDSEVQRFKRL